MVYELICSFVLVLLCFGHAEAYLDPGSGSYIFQIIAASFFVFITALGALKGRIAGVFSRKRKKNNDTQPEK